MKALLSAGTFGLLPLPLPQAVDPDRRQIAGTGGLQPDELDAEGTRVMTKMATKEKIYAHEGACAQAKPA
jgi:hypothetical protein